MLIAELVEQLDLLLVVYCENSSNSKEEFSNKLDWRSPELGDAFEAQIQQNGGTNSFVDQLVAVLNLISEHTSSLPRSDAPILSVKQQTLINRSLQFLVAVGLSPCLEKGVGIPLSKRLKHAQKLSKFDLASPLNPEFQLSLCTRCLFSLCLSHPELLSLVTSHFLSDVVAGYLQLQETAANSNLETKFEQLLDCTYKPLLMREFLVLQTGLGPQNKPPNWLRLACGRLLSRMLTGESGLIHLIQTMDDLSGSNCNEWKKAESLAQIVSKCPKQWQNRERLYYDNISAQLFHLFAADSTKNGRLVATMVERLGKACFPAVQNGFLLPLFTSLESPSDCVDLTRAIDMISVLCENQPPGAVRFLNALEKLQPVIFGIFSDIQDSVSLKRGKIRDILCFLLQSDNKAEKGRKIVNLLNLEISNDVEFFTSDVGINVRQRRETEQLLLMDRKVSAVLKLLDHLISTDSELLLSVCILCLDLKSSESTVPETDCEYFVRLESSKSSDLVKIGTASLFAVLIEKYQEKLLEDPGKLMPLIKAILERPIGQGSESGTYIFALGIVGLLILDPNTHSDLGKFIEPLTKLASEHPDAEIKQKSLELVELLKEICPSTSAGSKSVSKPWNFECLIEQLTDPLLPTRGHALIELRRMILDRNPDVMQRKDEIAAILKEQLAHEDSYIFLSAINSFSALTALDPHHFLPQLLAVFTDWENSGRSEEMRVKVGEVLVKTVRELGDLAKFQSQPLINVFLSLCQNREAAVRASALSSLAELCLCLSYKLTANLQELLFCAEQLMKSDPEPTVRRASVHLIRSIFSGAGADMLSIFEDSILSVYRTVKYLYANDTDMVVRLHAQLCLEEINDNMKTMIAVEKRSLIREIRI